MSIFWEMPSGGFRTLVGSIVDTCLRHFAEAFVVDNSGMAGFAGDDALRAVSFSCRQARRLVCIMACMDQKDLAMCVHSRCDPFIVGRPKDFGCGGDSQVHFLDKVIMCCTGAVVQTAEVPFCSSSTSPS